ncbi:hypothetical protein ES708_30315 [subsurface metagenome]
MKKLLIILTLVFLLCFTGILIAQENLQIYFLDVGQGDASVIISSSGQVAMIDSGPNEKLILNHLKNLDISHIDLLIATHAHADHITGMDKIIAKYKPRAFMDPGISHTSLTYIRMINAIEKYNIKYYQSTARKIQLGLMNFSVLPSASPKIYVSELNNNSVVIKLEYINFSCLYTGDIERGRENHLVKISSSNLESDITKIPHHGSSTSSTPAFIKKVNPKVAIISCGYNNRYGHPSIKTLKTLEKNGIDIYRTDINGTILINTDGYDYEIIVEKSPSRKISKKVININLATLEDFVQLLGIDEMIASNLLLYRTLNNGFKYPEEIKMVLGIGVWEWEEWKEEGWIIVVK